jgi:hypothetical protein
MLLVGKPKPPAALSKNRFEFRVILTSVIWTDGSPDVKWMDQSPKMPSGVLSYVTNAVTGVAVAGKTAVVRTVEVLRVGTEIGAFRMATAPTKFSAYRSRGGRDGLWRAG